MRKVHTWRFHVRTYEIDQFNHVNNVNYINYLEEAATQASTAAGYPMEWYLEHGLMWIVKKWHIRYFNPALYGEELEVRTWVSDARRVRSHREYDLRRVKDDAPIIRARTDWVFVERDTMKPRRIPENFDDAFGTDDTPLEDLGIRIRNAKPLEETRRYSSYRDVQIYEIDQANHVNNSVYLRWLEQAYVLAIQSAGWSLDRQLQDHNFTILQGGREIEYFKPAKMGDKIRIDSRIIEMARVRGAWIHEIYNDTTNELLVRDYSVGAFVTFKEDGTPKASRMPLQMGRDITGLPDLEW